MKSVLILAFNLFLVSATGPIVTTTLGDVEGFEYVTSSNTVSDVFLGVPFAQPPVGNLRFEKPVELTSFNNNYVNASAFGSACIPHAAAATPNPPKSEDCLYMNIIKPQNASNLPVLMWVHGGGFEFGSSHMFGYKGFANVYNTKGVIVVSIHYRVGIFGFLSTGNSIIPGNLGLWDMAAALKFLNKHIASFGGDPNQITVWGLSAGGCAAGQLALSEESRHLFRGAIQMSGSAYSSWGYGPTVADNSWDIIKRVGCGNEADVKTCMKGVSVQSVYDAVTASGYSTPDLNTVKWGPVIDGEFMTDTADKMLKAIPKAERMPVVMGMGDRDGGFFTLMGLNPFLHQMDLKNEQFRNFTRQDLVNTIRKLVNRTHFPEIKNYNQAIARLVDYYVDRDANGTVGSGFYVDRYGTFLNDIFFIVPAAREAAFRTQYGAATYVYSMDHYNKALYANNKVPWEAYGSVHTNEYPYMFEFWQLGYFDLFTDKEKPVTDSIRSMIIDFAKTRKPSFSNGTYNKFNDKGEYLSITPTPKLRKDFYKAPTQLWKKIGDLGFDFITMLQFRKQY